MKKIISILIFSMFFATGVKAENLSNFDLGSMSYEDILGDGLSGSIAEPVLSAIAPASPADEKEWTVMVYANAKDGLRYSQVWQMFDMKKIGSTDKVNVVIESGMPIKAVNGVASTMTVRMALGDGADSQYIDQCIKEFFEMDKGAIDYSVFKPFEDDIVGRKKNEDMGDWKNIANFTKWAKTNYPAKRYAFIIYGHGNGFFDKKKQEQPDKGISLDMQTGNYVTLPEFTSLMKETGKVDLLIMQSCLMQMAEVVYQVKDYVDVAVGSSELMWSVGYDFEMMLKTLNSNPNISSEEIGKLLANSYVERTKDYKLSGHASVISSSKLPGFVNKLNNWVDATIAADNKNSIDEGVKHVIRFDLFGITLSTTAEVARNFSLSGDLYDFVEIITEQFPRNTPEQKIARQKGRELMNYISRDLVYEYVYVGESKTECDFGRAHGLSLHIPPLKMPFGSLEGFENSIETLYWDLPFASETKWGAFLKWAYEEK